MYNIFCDGLGNTFLLVTASHLFLFVSAEVLLDMKASGSELGWLTLPYENGVSIYTSTGIFKTSGSRLNFLCGRREVYKMQLKICSC